MSLPAEAYSRLCQISKMKYFVKIFNNLTLSCIMFGHLTTLCIKGLKAVNPLRTEQILPNSQGRTYTSLMRSTLSELQQPKTYIYVLLMFRIRPKYFRASNQGRLYTSFILAAANYVIIRPYIINLYRCLVVGCMFLCQLSLDN